MQGMISQQEVRADALVVGGGLAGLVAATTLAKGGLKVVLTEKSGHVGGRAITQKIEDEYYFNLGAHALYRKGAAQRVLHELGVKWSGALPPSKNGHLVYRGQKFLSPTGTWSFLTTRLFSFREKLEAMRILGSLSRVDTAALESVSLRAWLDSVTKSERIKQFLSTIVRVTTYTNDAERLSAGAALAQVRLGLEGNVDYLDHGWQTLVDGALAQARAAGVKILTNASVMTIKRDGEGYSVHLRSGEVYMASAVVLATSPGVALSMVEGGRETVLRQWAEESIPVRAACLDVALKRLPRTGSGLFALGVDRPLYCIVHSVRARLAPEGGAVIHLMKYLETDAERDANADRRELEELLELVQPGWREWLVQARFLPAMTVSNAIVDAARGGMKGRPGPEVSGLPGMYVAGDWVGQEGMLLDAALASAHHTAKLILTRQGEARQSFPRRAEPQRLIA